MSDLTSYRHYIIQKTLMPKDVSAQENLLHATAKSFVLIHKIRAKIREENKATSDAV